MRSTFDLPDNLYRTLKVRAGLSGVSMRELLVELIERGLKAGIPEAGASGRSDEPPVIIPSDGIPIPALSRAELTRIEDEEDGAKYA